MKYLEQNSDIKLVKYLENILILNSWKI